MPLLGTGRIQYVLDEAGVKVLITQESLLRNLVNFDQFSRLLRWILTKAVSLAYETPKSEIREWLVTLRLI